MDTILQPMEATAKDQTLQNKFKDLEKSANATFAERDEVIEISVYALLSNQNVFMLGVPGTAKSALIRYFSKAITGCKQFNKLMGAFTTPDEVFGSVDLKALDDGKTRFVTDNMLPTANIVMLDEIWKSGPGILNSLLTALNEKIFQNGDEEQSIPLISAFSASNELPASEELNALYDRFAFRTVVEQITSASSLAGLLTKPTYKAPPQISLEEIKRAHKEIAQVTIPVEVADKLVELVMKLRHESVTISDRTVMRSAADFDPVTGKKLLSIIKVGAWLDGRTECEFEDLRILRHTFWHDPENRTIVAREVNRVADPYAEKALEFSNQVDKIKATLETDLKNARDNKAKYGIYASATQELKKIGRRIERVVAGKEDSPKLIELRRLHTRVTKDAEDITRAGTKGEDMEGLKAFQRPVPLPKP